MPLTGEALIRVLADVAGAQNSLKSLEGSLKNTTAATDKLGKQTATGTDQFGKFKSGIGQVVQQMTGFSIASLSVAGAVGIVGKTIIDSTRQVIAYNKQILDASRSTRMSTEDMSRFVQVGDDVGVSMNSITRALELATKNGFAPSINSLAELADKANAMNSPTERAAMLSKILGRNWAELNPILELGGQRIKELAAATQDGLVATEEEIGKTEKLRGALDTAGDEFKALGNEIGMLVVVPLAERLDSWNRALEILTRDGVRPSWNETDRLARSLVEVDKEMAGVQWGNLWTGLQEIQSAAEDAGEAIVDAFRDATAASVEAYLADQEYKIGVDDIAAAIAALRDKNVVINVTTVTEEVTRQTWEWRKAMNTANTGDDDVTGGTQRAAGGPLNSFITEVGEVGSEGIIGNRVIPHNEWMRMKRSGIVASKHMSLGGEVESGGLDYLEGTTLVPKLNPRSLDDKNIFNTPASESFFDTGTSSATAATIIAAATTSAAAAAEAAATQVATTMPRAISQGVSEQTAQQVQIQIAGNAAMTAELRAVRRQLQTMNATIVRSVRDAVASL